MLLFVTVSELRNTMRELCELYFTGAIVTHTKQSFMAKQSKPLVTITMGSVSRPINPPVKIIDGRPVAFYAATVPVQIDLFTHGRQMDLAPGFTSVMENTAEDDMLSFCDFLNSEYAVQWCHRRDIAIVVPNTVTDLTGIINDTNYEYRAMIEAMVSFTMTSLGYSGTLSIESVKHIGISEEGEPYEYSGGDIQADDVFELVPIISEQSSSGGGNAEFADDEVGYFTNVSINDKLVKKEET